MISIRVWNVESDHRDAKVVKFLEDEFFKSRQLGHISNPIEQEGAHFASAIEKVLL